MRILHITPFGQKQPVAAISSNLDGTFSIKSEDPEIQKYFQNLITTIASENPKLPLHSGRNEEVNGKIIEQTIQTQIDVKDERYLNALWDYFTRTPQEYNGQRIRAFVSNIDKKDKVIMSESVEKTIEKRKKDREDELQKLIRQELYNLHLNLPGFPKFTSEDINKIKVLANYFLVGEFITDKSRSKRDIVIQKMHDDNLEFDPLKHIFIYSPQKPGWVGASSILVVELPTPVPR